MNTPKALKELLIYQALNNAPLHRYLTKKDYINYSCITLKKMVKHTFKNIMM